MTAAPTTPRVEDATDDASVRPAAARPGPMWGARRAPTPNITRGPRLSPLTTDFQSVRHDLRRIGVLASGLFVILVALSLVIH